jgi:hypothetical protein
MMIDSSGAEAVVGFDDVDDSRGPEAGIRVEPVELVVSYCNFTKCPIFGGWAHLAKSIISLW